jgi:hypothetical protein
MVVYLFVVRTEQVHYNQILHFMAANAGHRLVSKVASIGRELLSDDSVECIGRGDVVRMVECLGNPVTQKYFQKESGLT